MKTSGDLSRERGRSGRRTLAFAAVAGTLAASAACGASAPKSADSSFAARTVSFENGYNGQADEVAHGSGNETVAFLERVHQVGQFVLVYGGDDKEVVFSVLENGEVVQKVGESKGGGGGGVAVDGMASGDAVQVSDANKDTHWAVYVVPNVKDELAQQP